MPRTPSEATRFTSIGPYISTKPASSSPTSFTAAAPPITARGSRIAIPTSAPPSNETPAQKMARLRAAATASKLRNEPSSDRIIRIGRIVADKAHRYTALGLMGFTIVVGMVATAGITDMLMHNRRRRAEWLADKEAETAKLLAEAKAELARGRILTEDQRLLINREKIARQAEEEKKRKPGVWTRVFGGAAETKTERHAGEVMEQGQDILQAVNDRFQSPRRQGEVVEEIVRPLGGPLDREAQRTLDAVSSTSRSWSSWIMGK